MKKIYNLIKFLIQKYKNIPLVAKASMWFVACTMLQKCISLITVPIFTRMMPTSEYGIYSTYTSWHSIISIFCTLNVSRTIYINNYNKANTEKEKNDVAIPLLSLAATNTIVLFVITLLAYPILSNCIDIPFYLICLLFLQCLFEPSMDIWTVKQRYEYKYVVLVVVTIIFTLLNSLLGILFVYLAANSQTIARVISNVLVQAVFCVYFYIYFFKQSRKVFSTKGWRHALDVQLPLLPHSLSLTILSSSDKIMISDMVGTAAAGIYSVAYSAGYVMNMLKNSIVDALKPWIYQKIKNEDLDSIKSVVNLAMLFQTFITFIFIALAPEIIYILAPSQYYSAVYVVPPVAASSFFTFLYNIFSVVGLYFEKSKKIMVTSISIAVLNIVLNLLFIPLFGYVAAAYTTLICYIFLSVAHYIMMRIICKEKLGNKKIFDIRFVIIMSIATISGSILFTLTYANPIIRYLILAGIVIYLFLNKKIYINLFNKIKK